MTSLIVPRRFRGPTESANGGYICGLVAALMPGLPTVRLLRPPPLDTTLTIAENDGRLEILHGDVAVAVARPGSVGDLEPPPAPTAGEAAEAASRYVGFQRHPAPECFVCGPERAMGDGLRLFCGALAPTHAGVVAAPWTPDSSLADPAGRVRSEYIWAALDCPGYAAVSAEMRFMLLGELTARIDRPVDVGEPCIVVGWHIASSGRKHEAGTALYGADGVPTAVARAIWIEPRATQ